MKKDEHTNVEQQHYLLAYLNVPMSQGDCAKLEIDYTIYPFASARAFEIAMCKCFKGLTVTIETVEKDSSYYLLIRPNETQRSKDLLIEIAGRIESLELENPIVVSVYSKQERNNRHRS